MILTALTPSVAVFISFAVFAVLIVVAFVTAYAKRDVTIDVTLLEFHR